MTSSTERPLVLVNSGAYTHQELSAEFGPLPPAFLPVGLGRLYELQVSALAPIGGDIHLTIPESFELPAWDAQRLAALDVEVVRTPDGLPLGAALLYALGQIGFAERALHVLHGDTPVDGMATAARDEAFVAPSGDGYRWAVVAVDAEQRVVEITPPDRFPEEAKGPRLCGYFAFRSAADLAQRLALAQGDFFAALRSLTVDEQGLTASTPVKWFDFGHVQTFFQSRRTVTTARAFNAVEFGDTHVRASQRLIRVISSRLPRIATDQTANLVGTEAASPADVMLPIIREVEAV